jgi:hypothetical protein
LMLVLNTGGNVFGSFTPLHWDSSNQTKCDDSLTSFLLTLKNLHNTSGRKFALKAEQDAIYCWSSYDSRMVLVWSTLG